MVAACKVAKEDFDASLKQLRFKVLSAKGQVEGKARDEAQRAAFAKLALPREWRGPTALKSHSSGRFAWPSL